MAGKEKVMDIEEVLKNTEKEDYMSFISKEKSEEFIKSWSLFDVFQTKKDEKKASNDNKEKGK